MTTCRRSNARKHREIKNGEQYNILDISSKLYFLDKREFTSSESKNYMVIPGKGITTSLGLSTKRSNKKKKSGFVITYITNQYLSKLLKNFNNSSYLSLKSKQVHN